MKKKGFTLVELLAVIAILAILVIIALPNVLGMFNNAKKNTFVTEVQSIYKQAQTDFISDATTLGAGGRTYCKKINYTTVGSCTKELNLTTTKDYFVKMDANGNVTYIAVGDKSFVFGATATISGGVITGGLKSIDQITVDKIKDASTSGYTPSTFEMTDTPSATSKKNTTM